VTAWPGERANARAVRKIVSPSGMAFALALLRPVSGKRQRNAPQVHARGRDENQHP